MKEKIDDCIDLYYLSDTRLGNWGRDGVTLYWPLVQRAFVLQSTGENTGIGWTLRFNQWWSPFCRTRLDSGLPVLAPKWVKLSQNGKNPGLFQIRFQYILARRAKMYWNMIWKSPGYFKPFLGRFDPPWSQTDIFDLLTLPDMTEGWWFD